MKPALISLSVLVVMLAIAASHILPSMADASKSRDYAQINVTSSVKN